MSKSMNTKHKDCMAERIQAEADSSHESRPASNQEECHQSRPAWTNNNVGLFNFWMRTGAKEPPSDWIDDADTVCRNDHRSQKPADECT
jgi:hypothetical protein